jgi:tight adherence protein B
MRGRRRIGCALALATLALAAPSYGAGADGTASIAHVESAGSKIQILVSVPGSAPVDLGSARLTLDGRNVAASAQQASQTKVRRVTVLAIDTSDSMAGARIAGAQAAANTFLDHVPANVAVGIVTFDRTVNTRLQPTLDRTAARKAVKNLNLARGTRLYDGVRAAAALTGTSGQRQVLLLSDGKDTTTSPLGTAVKAVKDSGVLLDAVSLSVKDSANTALRQLAGAGSGTVISAANPAALARAYQQEAQVLARQVLITATVPADFTAEEATAAVILSAGGTSYSDSAFVQVQAHPDQSQQPLAPLSASSSNSNSTGLPWAVALAAILAVGLGAGGIVLAAGAGRREDAEPATLADHVASYGISGRGGRPARAHAAPASASLADQARDVAGKVLSSNRDLEARIAHRLEAADLSLRPAEWLLLHAGLAVGIGLAGGLLGRGNPILLFLFLAVGVIGPWAYLGRKRAARLKAFNTNLADTLQMLASSLSAGLSLAQSIDTVVREGTEPISSEFRRVIVESRLGVGLEDALEGVAKRMDSKDFAWVVMAVRIQREVGGNLAELLNTVAATLREREYLRRHVAALSAEGRLSAWILGGLPPGFLAYLTLARPSYVHPMYTTPLGLLMCVAMAVLLLVGVVWMSKAAKVEV